MKFQNPSIHHSKVNTHTDRHTDTQTDKPKSICPSNFSKFGAQKVQIGNDQEMAQSERNSHSINRGVGKTKMTLGYLYHENMS